MRSNSQGCHRLTLIPVELHGPGYYYIGSPADQGYAEHMRAILAGMIWIHQDKNHRDKSNSRWVPPLGGKVVSILILT